MNALSAAFQRFFDGFEIPRAKLTLFRIVFFSLVALDAFLEIEHAPRYGAGDFNVAHFTFLDQLLPLPSRHGMLVAYVLQAYLALRIVMGVTVRGSTILLTALFGYSYFISQVDSYQHHYLLFLVLGISIFLPWKEERATLDPMGKIPAWAGRVFLCQISVLYFWTGIAKLDPHWLKGETLAMQVPDGWTRDVVHGVATTFGAEDVTIWAVIAATAALTELVLAVAVHIKRLWPLLPLFGLLFHGSIEFMGYKIGLFSYFMIAFYIWMMPDRWFTAPARFFGAKQGGGSGKKSSKKAARARTLGPDGQPVGIPGGGAELGLAAMAAFIVYGVLMAVERFERVEYVAALAIYIFLVSVAIQYYPASWVEAVSRRLKPKSMAGAPWVLWGGALLVGSLPLLAMPFDEAPVYIAAIIAVAVALDLSYRGAGRMRNAVAHLLAGLLLIGMHFGTDEARDYYRYMGGDARRRGDIPTAIHAYTKVTEISPEYAYGHRRLGDLYLRQRDFDLAIDAYQAAIAADPEEADFYVRLAVAFDAARQPEAAVTAAKQALGKSPTSAARAQAQKIIDKKR